MKWPQENIWPGGATCISPMSPQSLEASLLFGSAASATYPGANRAIYIPFRLNRPFVATSMVLWSGTALSGNFDLGIYTFDGVRLASTGSTDHTTGNTNSARMVALTGGGATLSPGVFHMAVAMDNTTATLLRCAPAAVGVGRMFGVCQQASAFALPATASFAALTSAYVPIIGVTGRHFV